LNSSNNIMVCVTQQKTCERLINKGSDLQKKLNGNLYIIHVVKDGVNFLGNVKEGDALEYLFNISKGVGADLTVLRSQNIVNALSEFAKDKTIGHIVLGEPPVEEKDEGIVAELKEIICNCEFHVIPSKDLK
jgi:K+-sensing histidine kinase KdpD